MSRTHAGLTAVLFLAGAACQDDSIQILNIPLMAPVVTAYTAGAAPTGAVAGDFIYFVAVKNFGDAPSPAMFLWVNAYGNCGGSAEFQVPALDPGKHWSPPLALVQSVTGCACKKATCDGSMYFSLRTGAHQLAPGPGKVGCPGPALSGPNTAIQVWWDESGDVSQFKVQEIEQVEPPCGSGG